LEFGDWCPDGIHCGQKVAINTCFGGFQLSHKAKMRYAELKGITIYPVIEGKYEGWGIPRKYVPFDPEKHDVATWSMNYTTEPLNPDGTMQEKSYWYPDRDDKEFRTDPCLIQTIEELGEEVNVSVSDIEIVEIPIGIDWQIEEYDGVEWISEKHRMWGR
jgi:hypothetical protein